MPESPEVLAFVSIAREFAKFMRTATELRVDGRVRRARLLVAQLYTASLVLPASASTSTSIPDETYEPPRWPGCGAKDSYRELFDPYEPDEEPVFGSLSDDLLDIDHEVLRGLALYDRGLVDDAIWHWTFSRDTHWGEHATGLLRALHREPTSEG